MDFKHIAQFIAVILIVFPIFAFASSQDYLFVSFDYDYATRVFSNVSADQRVVDSSKITGQDVGDHTITLEDSQGVLSQAKFFIPDPAIAEVESLGNDTGGYGSAKYYSATVGLALTRSVQAGNGTITISRNSQILLSQKLSDTPINILKSSNNRVITPTIEPSFPPYPPMPQSGSFIRTALLWSPLILLPIVLLVLWFLFKKRRVNQQAIPPTPPITPPAPPA